jgi:hypothetical protein
MLGLGVVGGGEERWVVDDDAQRRDACECRRETTGVVSVWLSERVLEADDGSVLWVLSICAQHPAPREDEG